MLGNKKPGARGGSKTTLISQDTIVVGDVRFNGNLEVEGVIQGNVFAEPEGDGLVRIVGKGCVEGEIRAPNIVVNGVVKGDVHCSRQLELASKGRVTGNVFYALVEMSAGAEVNGSLTHVAEEETTAQPARELRPEARSNGRTQGRPKDRSKDKVD